MLTTCADTSRISACSKAASHVCIQRCTVAPSGKLLFMDFHCTVHIMSTCLLPCAALYVCQFVFEISSCFSYTVLCVQALSALLWRPLASHTFRPTWNSIHQTGGKVTVFAGTVAVSLGIHVSGIGWPYYILHAFVVGCFLIPAALQNPVSKRKVSLLAKCSDVLSSHCEQALA